MKTVIYLLGLNSLKGKNLPPPSLNLLLCLGSLIISQRRSLRLLRILVLPFCTRCYRLPVQRTDIYLPHFFPNPAATTSLTNIYYFQSIERGCARNPSPTKHCKKDFCFPSWMLSWQMKSLIRKTNRQCNLEGRVTLSFIFLIPLPQILYRYLYDK